MEFNFKKCCDGVLVLLFLVLCLQLWRGPGDLKASVNNPVMTDSTETSEGEFELHLKIAKALMGKETLWAEAEKELNQAVVLNSGAAEPYLFLARLGIKKDDWTASAKNYRLAVERNPDLTDDNAKAYLGKELIAFTKEAIRKFRKLEREVPEDSVNLSNLKNAYYLKRKLAGGCD